jgi:hypothetical protein
MTGVHGQIQERTSAPHGLVPGAPLLPYLPGLYFIADPGANEQVHSDGLLFMPMPLAHVRGASKVLPRWRLNLGCA